MDIRDHGYGKLDIPLWTPAIQTGFIPPGIFFPSIPFHKIEFSVSRRLKSTKILLGYRELHPESLLVVYE
jgi:hypothetical protein